MDQKMPEDQPGKNPKNAKSKRALELAWLEENKQAIEDYNKRVDHRGMYNEGLRRF